MALRAVPEHPKFAQLKQRLGRPKYVTLGLLEAIWHFCGRFTPAGNIGKYSDQAIEAWVEWEGGPGALIDALIETHWIDRDPTHRLLVHDWKQHADKAAKQALHRAKEEFCSPTVDTPGEQVTTPGEHEDQNKRGEFQPWGLPVPGAVPVPVPGAEVREPREIPPSKEPANDDPPEGLTPLQYAVGILEQAAIPAGFSLKSKMAEAVEMLAKLEACAPAEAAKRMLARVRLAQESNETVNGFWIEDGKWKDTPHGTNKPSSAHSRVATNHGALSAAVARRIGRTVGDSAGPDAVPVSAPRPCGLDGGIPAGLRATGRENLTRSGRGSSGGLAHHPRGEVFSPAR